MRRLPVLAVALSFSCVLLLARALEPGELRGRLVLEETGTGALVAAAGAPVVLEGWPTASKTDANGRFVFRGVPVGDHTLRASLEVEGAALGVRLRGVRLEVVDGVTEARELGDIRLNSLGTLSGTVTRDGAAKPGVKVVAAGFAEAVTDAEGKYVLRLPAGEHELAAVYVDGNKVRSQGTQRVALGLAGTADFVLSGEDPMSGSISGTVAVATVDAPVAASGAVVKLQVAGKAAITAPPVDAEGRWSVETLPAGLYTVTVTKEGFRPQSVAPVAVVPGAVAPLLVLVPRGDCDLDGVADDVEQAACACDPAGTVDADGNGTCEPPAPLLATADCRRACDAVMACKAAGHGDADLQRLPDDAACLQYCRFGVEIGDNISNPARHGRDLQAWTCATTTVDCKALDRQCDVY